MNWKSHLTEETPAPWLRSAATPLVEFDKLCSVCQCHAYHVKKGLPYLDMIFMKDTHLSRDVLKGQCICCVFTVMSLCHCYRRNKPSSTSSGWFESPIYLFCFYRYVFVSLCNCVIVIGGTDLPQQPQGGLKVQDSCLSRSSKLHSIRQLCQQLHSVEVYHDNG